MSVLQTPSAPPAPSEPVEVAPPEEVAGNSVENYSVYEQKSGKPYLAKVYEAEAVWDKLDHETQGNAEVISEYFKTLQEKGEYRSDSVAYRDFLKKYEKMTDTKDAPFTVKVHKMGEFIKYLQRTA